MGFKLAIASFVFMAGMAAVGFWYYKDTQERIKILHQNNAVLESAAQRAEEATKALQENMLLLNRELQKVNEQFANIRAQNQILADKLAKHDLSVLGSEKPGLVSRVVNRATKKVGRCFELLSGAQLTQTEKEASSAKKFNSECPWLWPGYTNQP